MSYGAGTLIIRPGLRVNWLVPMAVLAVIAVVLATFILYPMSRVVIGSFEDDVSHWTLANYQRVFTPYYLGVMGTTLLYAVATVAVALAMAVPIAWLVARTDMPARGFLRACILVTFVLPPLFHAMAFVFLFQPRAGLVNTWLDAWIGVRPFNIYSLFGMVIVTAFGLFPQGFLLIDTALRGIDPSLEEAAVVAGARQSQILWRVVLPLVLPAILSSVILGVIEVLAVFGPPAVIGIPAKIYVMSTQLFIELSGSPPRIEFCAALSMLFLTVATTLLLVQDWLLRQRSFATITGKGFQPRQVRLGAWRRPAFGFCLLIVTVGLIVPALVLAVMSISRVWIAGFTPGNLTLDFYRSALMGQERTLQSLTNTLLLSISTVVGTLACGLPIAWIVTRRGNWTARAVRFVTYLPFSIPATVFTVGVILAFIQPPLVLYGSLSIVAACYFGRFLPLAVQPLSDALRQIDGSLMEAARVVGSGMARTTAKITLPLLKYSVLSTSMLVFVACAREIVSIALLYSPGTETLMMTAMLLWDEGQVQITAALVMCILGLVAAFYALARVAAVSRTNLMT